MEPDCTYKNFSDLEDFDEIDLNCKTQRPEVIQDNFEVTDSLEVTESLEATFDKLEDWEKIQIVQVILKDIEEEDRLAEKISRLREELAVLRRRGVLRAGSSAERACGRCRAELGRIINRGAICRGCSVRVCKTCREYTTRSGQDWICSICQKNKEIAAASGQWVNEFIPNNGRKGGGKVYVPSTAELLKRNIRRSWTISNPSGTEGPMMNPRGQDPRNFHRPDLLPVEDDLPLLTGRREDDIHALPLSSRPVVVAQIPPPPSRVQRFNNVPSIPLNSQMVRNLPVRTQSLGVGDSGRFMGRGGPPRFRPPPPPEDRRMCPDERRMRREIADTSSDGEDMFETGGVGDYMSWDRRKYKESRFNGLEPRSKSGGDTHSLERKHFRSATDTHSLERRRRLPDVPSHSLPRPEKRSLSDNRGRSEATNDDRWRSHSQGDIVDNTKRKLPNVPGGRNLREPTPDYDSSSPPPGHANRQGRRNSDVGVPSEKQTSVRRNASTMEKTRKLEGVPLQPRHSPILKKMKPPPETAPPKPVRPTKAKIVGGKLKAEESINFSDLESTRIDFDEGGAMNHVSLESDNNSDIVFDETKMVPAGKDFKIVFISSESKSGSELNSSLECELNPEHEETLNNVKGDFIDEQDWLNYKKKIKKTQKAEGKKSGKNKRTLSEILHRNSPKTFLLDDFNYVGNLNGESRKTPISPIVKRSLEAPQMTGRLGSPRPPFGSPRLRHPSNSPSIKTILTSATKDPNSIPASPSIPKIHNIAIRREYELPPRPRSAMSNATMCSETSQDIEVQNILGIKYGTKQLNPNESQEIMIDFDTTQSDSFDLNHSFDMSHINKRMPNLKSKDKPGDALIRSSEDRSMDEMSLHDQIIKQNSKKENVEEFRNLVLAEIKSIQGNGLVSRSLSESDLSELDSVGISGRDSRISNKDGGSEKNNGGQKIQNGVEEKTTGPVNSLNFRFGTTTRSISSPRPRTSSRPSSTPRSTSTPRPSSTPRPGSTPRPMSTSRTSTNIESSTPSSSGEHRNTSGYSPHTDKSQVESSSIVAAGVVLNRGVPEEYSTRLSTSTSPPPPLLPPKTRKLLPAAFNQSEPSIGTVTDTSRPAGLQTSIGRSISSVGQGRTNPVVRKPVRRSKSQLPGSKYVASIQHGGLVTLVSLSDEKHYMLDADLTPGFVSRQFNHNPNNSAFQGSNTLPRAGQLKKKTVGTTLDDSEIVITKKLTGAGSSVRIRIGGSARSPTHNLQENQETAWNQDTAWQENLINKFSTVKEPNSSEFPSRKQGSDLDKKRRRYTLDQIEREEFKETETEISEPEEGVDDVNSDFDLNSLIEGVVDDDSETDRVDEDLGVDEGLGVDKELESIQRASRGKVVRYLEPLKDPEESVDGPDEFSEEELESLAVNLGSLANHPHQHPSSDTEEDFLDKVDRDPTPGSQFQRSGSKPGNKDSKQGVERIKSFKNKSHVTPTILAPPTQLNRQVTPLLELPSTDTPRATPQYAETSDFDSISTTSASYCVQQSDLESLCIDDTEGEMLITAHPAKQLNLKSGLKETPMELKEIQGSRAIHPNDNSAGATVPTTDQTEGQDRTVRRASVPGSPLSRVTTSSVETHPCEDGRGRGHVNPVIGTSENKSESKRKGSVSQLIARFEGSRSCTPERRSCTPDRGINAPERRVYTPESKVFTPERNVTPGRGAESKLNSSTPNTPGETVVPDTPTGETEPEPEPNSVSNPLSESSETQAKDISSGAIPKKKKSKPPKSEKEPERAELKGLKEFTLKYLSENALKASEASALSEVTEEDCDFDEAGEMAPTIRRNSGGGYTSYVFISNEPSHDEVGSVVSSSGSYTDPDSRVTVSFKEPGGISSPNTCVVSIQDGRTSNISIVSTESSELNSPIPSPILDGPPSLPAKLKDHNELQQVVLATRESMRDFSHRSRGGEEPVFFDEVDRVDPGGAGQGGLANYFTSTLESSFISRRGRPPVIRAAEKVRRQQGHFEYEDESRGMMIDYSDHQDYQENQDEYPDSREGSSTPVLNMDREYTREKFRITDLGEDEYLEQDSDNYEDYEINYNSGDSGEEYLDMDAYMGPQEYSMCQPVYDSEEYSHSEGEAISGDEFDREEELRGYNRAIDFTLHTIQEESCEESESENRSLRDRKRHSDPSELEKYFFYGVGGGASVDPSIQDESEYTSDDPSEQQFEDEPEQQADKEQENRKQLSKDEQLAARLEKKITSRLEDYFMAGLAADTQQSLDGISDRGNTDDSGSVGSESDGQPSPEHRRKKISRTKFRSDRSGESEQSNVEEERQEGNSSGEDGSSAFVSGDGSFDTIKRKKNKTRKGLDDRRPSDVDVRREPVNRVESADNESLVGAGKKSEPSPRLSPFQGSQPDENIETPLGEIVSDKTDAGDLESKGRSSGSTKNSPSTSPPLVSGPVRKHKSRDSGFVGSNDDLLRNEGSSVVHTSSDDTQGKNGSSSEGELELRKTRLEKVSEVSENTEDDCDKSTELAKSTRPISDISSRKKSNESDISKEGDVSLSRKDSFHQWSSDEETNIMMNRMRAFFKNMMVNASKGTTEERKPTQILHFENQLTRLMRTVPGINEQQVKEIVEYLSSEDTWSDSYDSSDYTDATSSDLELQALANEDHVVDLDVVIQEPTTDISIGDEDFLKETAIMYQKLMNSVAKMQQSSEDRRAEEKRSPPITAKILHHISSRLITLMHEVSGSENSSVVSRSDSRQDLYDAVTSSPKIPRDEQDDKNYTFDSLDSPKVLLGPKLGGPGPANPFRFTKNTSKSVEILDLGPRRASLDDRALKHSMGKSTSSDHDVWHGVHREQRRGSLPRGNLENQQSGVSDPALDDETFSWKGSFESALASDSRTRLSIEAKRRSVEDEYGAEMFSSAEQMDRNPSRSLSILHPSSRSPSHPASRSPCHPPSRSPSQSSRRSGKSSIQNTRGSLVSRLDKEREHTPTTELRQTQDSDSDSASGSISSSIRSSSISQRRSSIPEQQLLARLAEDSPPVSPVPRPVLPVKTGGVRHSTNSLPRLGTSSIQKNKSTNSLASSNPSQPTNIQTSIQGGVRSARYRPHGYKPPPPRKVSTGSIGGSSRKSSIDSLGRLTDDADISSKSGTPSPMVSRGGGSSACDLTDLRDFPRSVREGSAPRSVREGSAPRSVREGSVPRSVREGSTGSNDTVDGEDEKFKSSTLGNRSESLASIYSQGEGRYGTVSVHGDIEFGFMYNLSSGSLDISIKQCRDLAAVDTKRNRSDPYVKVYLLPDKSKPGKRKTKVKKHTLNPVFEEILKFMMPLVEVERRTMWISVWHSDMFGRNDFLGEVMMPMAGLAFDDPTSKWFTLQDRTEPPEEEVLNTKGNIILALKYVPAEPSRKDRKRKGTLMLLVKEAKNIPLSRGNTLPDPYCKCYLLPDRVGKNKQKTSICRRTTSPRWDTTMTWDDLSISEVEDRSLEIILYDHDRMGHHEMMGGIRLNLGTGKHGGKAASWMDGAGRELTLWQQMLDRQNFWVEGSVPVRTFLEPVNTRSEKQ